MNWRNGPTGTKHSTVYVDGQRHDYVVSSTPGKGRWIAACAIREYNADPLSAPQSHLILGENHASQAAAMAHCEITHYA